MPIIKSAKKRVRVAGKAAARNSKTKRVLRGALKLFGRKSTAASLASAQAAADRAAKKGVIHKNKAARIKKRLAAQAKAGGVKAETQKKTASKPAAKKTTAAKKPATKKAAPAKKPAAKKAPAKKTTKK
jgi:ribosomal protein S20